jgi:CRISPR-associated protein Csd1
MENRGMILGSLCEVARRDGLLTNADYEPKPVAWIIAVGDGGKFVNLVPTAGDVEPGKKPKVKMFQIPRRAGRTSSAVADFLVDKSEYVLGVEPDGKRSADDLRVRLGLFLRSVREAREATGNLALAAVEAFVESGEERGSAVGRVLAEGYKSNDLFAFEYHGRLVHELPEVREYFSRSRRAGTAGGVQCLICGSTAPPVKKHPAVRIPGGTTSGIALVSFNSDAFESYGLSRNENAPVCRNCADAYTTALNRLLSDRYPDPRLEGATLPRRFVRLSPDTTAVFWADQEAGVLDLFTSFFNAPRVESVRALLEAAHKNRTPELVSNRFYCLILSGGHGRAILRGMLTGMVAQVENNVGRYFESIDTGSDQPLPLFVLMRSLVLQGNLEHLAPGLVTDVFLAIVFGECFPQTLLVCTVGRCRVERQVTRERAAMLRAYLKRNANMEVTVGLDKENTSAGYRLGRLIAVLERLQRAAQNNPSKTIVDRYYGAASTRPAVVFPRLIAGAQHHLAKLAGGWAVFYQTRLGEVLDGIASFPQTLRLDEQGLFALGYYHQRQDFFKRRDSDPASGENGSKQGDAE